TAASLTILGPISGTGALIKTGILPLSYGRPGGAAPDATFSGGAQILGGGRDLWGDGDAMPAFGSGTILLNNANLTVHNTNNASWVIANPIRVDGVVAIRSERGGPVVLTNDVVLNGTLNGDTLWFSAGKKILIENSTTGLRAIYPSR